MPVVAQPDVAQRVSFDAIRLHQTAAHTYCVTQAVYQGFLETFGDRSPLHVDEAHARGLGFEGTVMHGAILNGFISHFVGMCFPGRDALVQSVSIQYRSPTLLDDVLELAAEVAQKVDSVKVIVLAIEIRNATRGRPAASARAQIGFTA
jgi:3-hydroxybutyryl-CoA dehydratase